MPAAKPAMTFPGRIGLGTWKMGASAAQRSREISAVEHALAVGYRLIDTAEMYADGGAERVIGGALKSFGAARRSELFIVSKVLPTNASRAGTTRSCQASIARMGCEYLDLYLLHWPGSHRFSETLQAFAELQRSGAIRRYGVSNLDLNELTQWLDAERELGLSAQTHCNQLFYCLEARGIEFEQLPWQRAHGVQTMAYSPLGQGRLASDRVLTRLGRARDATAAQMALAWSIRDADVVAIPKSIDPKRIDENLRAADLRLTAAELAQIDAAFPSPHSQQPLQMV